jgi:cytochrome c-type biogenesis protein CcmE
MRARSQYGNRRRTNSIKLVLTGVALAIILLLIVFDTSAALFRLTATSQAFPPAVWAVTPPEWVD